MLDLLRRIVQEVSAAPDLKSALQLMAQRVCEAIESEACSIFILDRWHNDYVLMATDGLNVKCIGHTRLGLHDSLVGVVAQREEHEARGESESRQRPDDQRQPLTFARHAVSNSTSSVPYPRRRRLESISFHCGVA